MFFSGVTGYRLWEDHLLGHYRHIILHYVLTFLTTRLPQIRGSLCFSGHQSLGHWLIHPFLFLVFPIHPALFISCTKLTAPKYTLFANTWIKSSVLLGNVCDKFSSVLKCFLTVQRKSANNKL